MRPPATSRGVGTAARRAEHEAPTRYNPPDMKFDRITFDPQVLGGRACIRGMRVPVSVVVSQIAHGATPAEVLRDYPDLQREDVQQAIEYAAWLASEQVLVE